MNGRDNQGSYPPPGYTPPPGYVPPPGYARRPPIVPAASRSAMFLQAIRGPVLLITIGVLFAMQEAGIVSFSRTWPLILIVIGLMKLLERMAGPGRNPGVGGPLT